MTTKHIIAAAALMVALVASTGLACASPRIRDLFFFLIASLQIYFDRMDVNFMSMEWYRGSTRGFEVSLLDVLAVGLLIGLIVAPRYRPRIYWPASLGFMLLFLLFEGFSTFMAQPKIFGAFETTKMARAIIVFLVAAFYVRTERELRILLLALAVPLCLESLYCIKHRFLLHMDRAVGTFDAPNSLSLYVCTVAPVLVAGFNSRFPNWLRYLLLASLGAATLTVFLTVSRAGIPAYGVVMLAVMFMTMSWQVTLKKVLAAMALAVAIFVPLMFTWDALAERYKDTSLNEEFAYNEYENRGQYIGLAAEILKDRPLGVGLNNWSYWVSKVYGPRSGAPYEDYDATPTSMMEQTEEVYQATPNYAPPAHNVFVLTVGEMGWLGLFVFLLLWLRWFRMGASFFWVKSRDPMLRMGTGFLFAVCGIFLQSQTEWVYRQTTVMMTFYVILGALASLYYQKRYSQNAVLAKTGVVTPAPALVPVPLSALRAT
jgi:O-antigen ligase